MRRSVRLLVGLSLSLGGALAYAHRPRAVAPPPTATDYDLRNEQIRVWRQALAADSTSALVRGQLAGLYLQRAREGGGWVDYQRAESLATLSYAARTSHNGKSGAVLVAALIAQHKFSEALARAQQLVKNDPEVPAYRSALAEVAMERGDYGTAQKEFDLVWSARTHLSIAPRLARWLELSGQPGAGIQLLETARTIARERQDVPSETRAWFSLRLGDALARLGKGEAAAAQYEAGLALLPNDPRLLGARARLALANGDAREAIQWGERALEFDVDPLLLGVLSDGYQELGDSARAHEYRQAMETAVSAAQGAYHRAWDLWFLDHGADPTAALARTRKEYEGRRDVYGADLLAWAHLQIGDLAQANRYAAAATRLGTADPLLWYHDGVIAAKVGDAARARRSLERALDGVVLTPAQRRFARDVLKELP